MNLKKVARALINDAVENIIYYRQEQIDDEFIDWKEDWDWIFKEGTNFKECCDILGKDFVIERTRIYNYIDKISRRDKNMLPISVEIDVDNLAFEIVKNASLEQAMRLILAINAGMDDNSFTLDLINNLDDFLTN